MRTERNTLPDRGKLNIIKENKMALPKLEDVDFTKTFTPEQQEEVNKLPREQRLQYMERSDSANRMTQEEREKHYRSENFPQPKYHSSGGGGAGSVNPPKLVK